MSSTSHFNARTDSAAQAIKGQLSRQLGKEIPLRSVPVGPNGQPAPPLPPEGSYARQAIERQRQAAEQQRPNLQSNQPPAPPQQGAQEEPEGDAGHQPTQDQTNLSPNAQRRFSELSQTLRQKDQELQQARASSKALEESNAQLSARLKAIEDRFNSVVNQNLEALDPETRQQVLSEAAIAQSAAQIEQRVMQRVAPTIDHINAQAIESELRAVAGKYPNFSIDVHGPLIEMFRRQNPNCSIEQAFRAVAEPEELVMSSSRAAAVPPVAVPQTVNSAPRYVPTPAPKTPTIEEEIETDRRRAFDLARSTDPNDRRNAGRAMDQYLVRKLGGNIPGRR